MTITRIGNLTETGVDITSHKIYFTLGFHDDVKLVIRNTLAVNTLIVTSVKCWSDPENALGRVSALPTVDDIDTIALTPVSPVSTEDKAVIYVNNAKTYTHMEIDYKCTGAGAETTSINIYLVGRVH